jgi:hypothetical protein
MTVPHEDRDGPRSPLAPDAGNALEALEAGGWEVVVLDASAAGEPPDTFGQMARGDQAGGWLLTDQVADARWARPLGLRTALVGPAGGEGLLPERCDFAFRDLRTAALEILAQDAVNPQSDT